MHESWEASKFSFLTKKNLYISNYEKIQLRPQRIISNKWYQKNYFFTKKLPSQKNTIYLRPWHCRPQNSPSWLKNEKQFITRKIPETFPSIAITGNFPRAPFIFIITYESKMSSRIVLLCPNTGPLSSSKALRRNL